MNYLIPFRTSTMASYSLPISTFVAKACLEVGDASTLCDIVAWERLRHKAFHPKITQRAIDHLLESVIQADDMDRV